MDSLNFGQPIGRNPADDDEHLADRQQRTGVFVVYSEPPRPPALMAGDMLRKFVDAMTAIGGLNALATTLPYADLLIHSALRKEAVLSSQIAGNQAYLHDLSMLEMGQRLDDTLANDAQETVNHLNALRYATQQLEDGAQIDIELIQEMHRRMLQRGRESPIRPGEFEDRENHLILQTEYARSTPRPTMPVYDCMADLAQYVEGRVADTYIAPPLVMAGAAQAQFETIHPFRVGNGRVGRMIVLFA